MNVFKLGVALGFNKEALFGFGKKKKKKKPVTEEEVSDAIADWHASQGRGPEDLYNLFDPEDVRKFLGWPKFDASAFK